MIRETLSRRLRPLGAPETWSWELRARPADGLCGMTDHGDLIVDRRTDTATRVHRRLRALASAVAAMDHRPLVIGGDHSVSYPTIAVVAAQHPDLCVVHFDAHADRRAIGNAPTADCGNVVSWVLADVGELDWLTIGVRGTDPGFAWPHGPNQPVQYLTAEEACEPTAAEHIARFCADRSVYLTVDIDVLDPVYAPEVVYSSYGGLDPRQLHALLRAVSTAGELVGADMVEACPDSGRTHMAATRLADVIVQLQLFEAGAAIAAAPDADDHQTHTDETRDMGTLA